MKPKMREVPDWIKIPKTVIFQFRIDQNAKKQLDDVAESMGITTSKLVRDLVMKFLEQEPK